MIAFDAGVLVAYSNPKCSEDERIRIDALIKRASASRQRIILPSPAVAEYLAGVGDPVATAKASSLLRNSKVFKIAPFGDRASLETALVIARVKSKHARKHEGSTWAKAKFDWQVASIAKVENASAIYTTDRDVVRAAEHMELKGIYILDMPLPDEARQTRIPFTDAPEERERF